MSWTHVEPRNVHTLNETTFLVTYTLGILANKIGSAIEKIGDSLGKPVVITCDEVTLDPASWCDRACMADQGSGISFFQ